MNGGEQAQLLLDVDGTTKGRLELDFPHHYHIGILATGARLLSARLKEEEEEEEGGEKTVLLFVFNVIFCSIGHPGKRTVFSTTANVATHNNVFDSLEKRDQKWKTPAHFS